MSLLDQDEKEEVIQGVVKGFRDAEHVHRQLGDFAQGVMLKALPPSQVLLALVLGEALSQEDLEENTVAQLLKKLKSGPISRKVNRVWDRTIAAAGIEGRVMASVTAMCVERHVQNSTYFVKGEMVIVT